MISKATTILKSFLAMVSAQAAIRNGTIGSEYLITSLWETKRMDTKNIPTNQVMTGYFILLSLRNPRIPKR